MYMTSCRWYLMPLIAPVIKEEKLLAIGLFFGCVHVSSCLLPLLSFYLLGLTLQNEKFSKINRLILWCTKFWSKMLTKWCIWSYWCSLCRFCCTALRGLPGYILGLLNWIFTILKFVMLYCCMLSYVKTFANIEKILVNYVAAMVSVFSSIGSPCVSFYLLNMYLFSSDFRRTLWLRCHIHR